MQEHNSAKTLQSNIEQMLMEQFNIDRRIIDISSKVEEKISRHFKEIEHIAELNQLKVLKAMQNSWLGENHFEGSTGYGYDDAGRDKLEEIYAKVFKTEDALVRPQIISGTHALSLALFGNLRQGDELLSPVGTPYDTLKGVIGINPTKGSLAEHEVTYRQVDLLHDDSFDYENIAKALSPKTKMVTIQRSKGYSLRKSLTITEIKNLINFIRSLYPHVIIMVDNCYGEFVNIVEPAEIGADLVVGSLIKNPGGGLAPVGGYIAGKKEYVEGAAIKLSSPGIGKKAGPSLGITSRFLQGLFLAPNVVAGSVKGAVFAAELFEVLGYDVFPGNNHERADIVQALVLKNPESVISFCKGIQAAAPVDSYVVPEPWDMPGYDCQVIMAAGSFISGSSIELSADAPIRPPYAVFFQGALTWSHAKCGVLIALNNMVRDGLCSL